MLVQGEKSHKDLEAGPHRCPATAAAVAGDDSDESLCFSDTEDRSWHSRDNSNCPSIRSLGEEAFEPRRKSSLSNCSFEFDLEDGLSEIESNLEKIERDCRICHLGLETAASESGFAIVLGCSCKEDLALAHKQCAETWFKIRGNKTCEICGSTAQNVVGSGETESTEQSNEASNMTAAPLQQSETRSFWQGHRFLNFLLACMVFAFVISWLFHFNVPG
ncbi:uncharacterized protein LOC109728040 [Ananas comosus]|uniref:Uncharacterized protein LOC109728040 n=1 Tax=Ananas comosus TaxID=4615 RepID=A0A6P5HE90_ANACO|nr:uncharacterized protein LOC109728040 [Ananas comosus]